MGTKCGPTQQYYVLSRTFPATRSRTVLTFLLLILQRVSAEKGIVFDVAFLSIQIHCSAQGDTKHTSV